MVYSMKLQELTLDIYKRADIVIASKDSQSILTCLNYGIPIYFNKEGKVYTIQGLYIADIIISN